MRLVISVLAFSVLVSGCVNGRFHKESITGGSCPGTVDGYTHTRIEYGNGLVEVIQLSKITANSEWRFYLRPDRKRGGEVAYGDSLVTVEGKAAGSNVLPGGARSLAGYVKPTPPNNDNWLTASGRFSTAKMDGKKRYITACVDADVVPDQEWHFKVTIEDVGSVDPRGRVIRK